jgi:hypothetical protein
MRADEITIETAKTGIVTVVVAVMSIFSKKRCKSQSANFENENPSCQKADSFPRIEKPFLENKKRPVTKEISI